jgi:hypothetical protein
MTPLATLHPPLLSIELGEQADFPDIGLLGAFSLAAKLKRGNHLLTKRGHEISPFVR